MKGYAKQPSIKVSPDKATADGTVNFKLKISTNGRNRNTKVQSKNKHKK